MSTELIEIRGAGLVSVSAVQEAMDTRDDIALKCGTVQAIVNATQAEHAAAILKEVANYTGLIEASRKSAKEPVLELGRKIDALGKELTDHLLQEKARISKVLGAYTAEQNRLAYEAQRKAQEEEARILREAEAKKAEIELHASSAKQADRQTAKLEEKTFNAVAEVRASAAAVAVKPIGIATRTDTKFEVTDIHALYAARPELVKLTEDRTAINSLLKKFPKLSVPGLRTWEESTAIAR